MRRSRSRSLVAALAAMVMVLAACSDGDEGAAAEVEEEEAPLALDLDEPAEEVVEEEEEVVEEEAPAFDLVAAVDTYASTIPDGWMFERDAEAFKQAIEVEGAVLIDVRELSELDGGYIPGAINIPIRSLAQSLELIPDDRPVWIYCATGWRAGLATSSLRMIGYDNVLAYPAGLPGWEAAGFELATGEIPEGEVYGDPGFAPEMVEAVDGFLSTMPEGFYTNSLDAVKDAVEAGAVLVDAREPGEYEEGFIPDALSVPLRTTVSTDVEVPTDANVIVYCQSGFRAALALPMYHVLGYTNMTGFPGSFAAWVAADEAVTS